MSEWLIHRQSEPPLGPVSTELLQRGVEAGRVPPDALVSRVGESTWVPVLTALRSVPEPSALAAVETSTAALDEAPPFIDRCPQCERKSLRWRSRSKNWKCTECGRVVDQDEARRMVKAAEDAERERLKGEAEVNAYVQTSEDITRHIQKIVSKTVPRDPEDSPASAAATFVGLLCIGGCIGGAYAVFPLSGWVVHWLGGGVVGLIVAGIVASLFPGQSTPTSATSYKPGRLVVASAQVPGVLASVDPLLLHAAEKLARFRTSGEDQVDDVDDSDDEPEEDLDPTGPDYLNLRRFGRRTRQLLRGTPVVSEAAIVVPKGGEKRVRIPCEDVVDVEDVGWSLLGLCLLADRHASDRQLEKIQELVRVRVGRSVAARGNDGHSASGS